MLEPYFDYHLKGRGEPFPEVSVLKADDPSFARFRVRAPRPLTDIRVYWAKADPPGAEADANLLNKTVKERVWNAQPAGKISGDTYGCRLPEEAAMWFAVVSDERPVSVSGDLTEITPSSGGSARH